jgi:hypothetical protein
MGETPFDTMSREDLMRAAQRLYSAACSAGSALRMLKLHSTSPYWGKGGTGGEAIEKCEQAVIASLGDYTNSDVYGSFYRYADDLLFEGLGAGWAICPECGTMLGRSSEQESLFGKACADVPGLGKRGCKGVFRALAWEDLTSVKEKPIEI